MFRDTHIVSHTYEIRDDRTHRLLKVALSSLLQKVALLPHTMIGQTV